MSGVDISLLAAPAVVEPLDYEAVLAELKAEMRLRLPAIADTIELESEPVTKVLEVAAYREVLLRARINDAARSVMLAYAIGTDLDHLGANYDVPRLSGEDDARFRARIQQAYHRLAAAGPVNAYRQHVLGVSIDIIDVDVWSEAPGQVAVAVLARTLSSGTGQNPTEVIAGAALFGPGPDPASAWIVAPTGGTLLRAILAALNAEDVRPLTDAVVVRATEVRLFTIEASIEVLTGPDPELIQQRRRVALAAYLANVRRIGYDVTRAGIIAALVEPGVKNVHLHTPTADIVCAHGEIAACTTVALTTEVVDA